MLIEMMIDFCSKFKEGYFASVWSLCKLFGKEHMVIPNLLGSLFAICITLRFTPRCQTVPSLSPRKYKIVFYSTCFKGSLIMVACSYLLLAVSDIG